MKNRFALLVVFVFAFTLAHAQQQLPPPPDPMQLHQSPAPSQPQSAAQLPDGNVYTNSTINYNIIDAPSSTFGYDVFVDGRLMIHQTSIPAMPGNEGFKTKEDAAKVAEMVMYKIRKGEMPPTVSIEEMKKLGVVQ